jgi:hypothetical protein
MKLDAKKFEPASSTNMLLFALMGIGALSFAAGLFRDPARLWHAYLLYHSLFFGLGVGAIFFLVVHYLASAGWNVALRRVTESFASYLFYAAGFSLLLLGGLSKLYPWTDLHLMESDHVLRGKIGYFSVPFFTVRMLAFFAMISFFAWKLIGNSVNQDQEGGTALSDRQKGLSALFLVLFAPMFTILSVDLIKSLDPKWFSTMFGVYVFVGFVQASVAAIILTIHLMQKKGYLSVVTEDHFHDLGKYLFGFSIFWAYIGVSQYLLIWYANLPEETTYYILRANPTWVAWSLLLPATRFILPFLLLLPRKAKRTPSYLVKVCCLVLFGAWLDLYLLIMPNFSPNNFAFSVWDIGLGLGFLGVFVFVVRSFLAKHATVPVKDPFLHETLHHHVM